MSEELTTEDWQQIALFYQKKFNELEMNVLGMEIAMSKNQPSAPEAAAPVVADEDE